MRPLKDWPGSRVAAVWLLWPAVLAAAVAVVAAIVLWRVPPARGEGPVGITGWVRLDPMSVLRLGAAFVGPPAVLTAIWAYARRRHHADPSA